LTYTFISSLIAGFSKDANLVKSVELKSSTKFSSSLPLETNRIFWAPLGAGERM